MRTIRLLATSLLVALSMGVSSCGDDELEVNPPTTSGGETSLELICKEYGITDYKDIDLLNYFIHANNTIINKEQANFTGLKDNHLWVATYHNSTKEKLGLSGNFWLVSFKISYLCLPLFYETRTTPSCHPSGCAYRQL